MPNKERRPSHLDDVSEEAFMRAGLPEVESAPPDCYTNAEIREMLSDFDLRKLLKEIKRSSKSPEEKREYLSRKADEISSSYEEETD